MTKEEKIAALVDPEDHFQTMADTFRDKLDELNEYYKECLSYGLYADFYIGPNPIQTWLPVEARFRRTQTWKY